MTTKTTATKTTAPAVKPAVKPTVKPTVKPAVKPSVKVEPAKTTAPAVKTTAPAVKVTAPSVKVEPTKTTAPAINVEAPKAEKARKARISKVDSAWTALSDNILELVANDSKSSVGQFIIKFFKENQTKTDITGELLAKAFVTSFKTKTGITPDIKWARRNVKLFIDNGVMIVKGHQLSATE